MSTPSGKKWTKREIKAMTGAIDSFLICRPIRKSVSAAELRAFIDEKRVAIIVSELGGDAANANRYVESYRGAIANEADRPELFGADGETRWDSDDRRHLTRDERIAKSQAKWEACSKEMEAKRDWHLRLIARVQTEHLPPDVVAYDPTTRVRRAS